MKKMASFILAFIFLGSNLGFAVGTHFCGGHAMEAEVVLGHKNLSCGMMNEAVSSIDYSQTTLDVVPCCENEFKSLQIEDDFQNTLSKVVADQIIAITPPVVVADLSHTGTSFYPSHDYTPPIRTDEVSILFQVFRI